MKPNDKNAGLPVSDRPFRVLIISGSERRQYNGIHHSDILEETDSNYAVIFSFWDRRHSTARLNVNQNIINIGSPIQQDHDLTIGQL